MLMLMPHSQDTTQYLPLLLPPVLKCFMDPEPRVRYYACEALYNITKVARSSILVYFNEIFDGLCKVLSAAIVLQCRARDPLYLVTRLTVCVLQLYSDQEIDVKNGAQLLDRLLKVRVLRPCVYLSRSAIGMACDASHLALYGVAGCRHRMRRF